MQNPKRAGRSSGRRQRSAVAVAPQEFEALELVSAAEAAGVGDFEEDAYRVVCPDCARPIALHSDDDVLPRHGMCPTPWDPFGLQLCPGTGRRAADAAYTDAAPGGVEQESAQLLTLPQGLDWRTQPFSHAGGHRARPRVA
ncbi:hypothetical protein [Streptomyces sp. NPDC050560]|uniref:hypothetical protein n=1 Tax=Streptomyces sp. NPDC050560 TaxID=3365630 RepID=UPI0037A5B9B1